MSLRELALKHLHAIAKTTLSQRDKPSAVPAGQIGLNPHSSKDSAVPAKQLNGTTQPRRIGPMGHAVPLGQYERGGTTGTLGTSGTGGTTLAFDQHSASVSFRRTATAW